MVLASLALLGVIQSALGVVAFMVGLGAPRVVRWAAAPTAESRRAPWMTLPAALGVGAVACWVTFDLLVGALGRDPTLSGRTLIWERVAPVAADAMLLGHGYKGFFGVADPLVYGPRLEPIPHPHNALLAAAVDLGVFSLLLVAALYMTAGVGSVQAHGPIRSLQ